MGVKLRRYNGKDESEFVLTFFCPGCKREHPYSIPRWTWNGDMEKPTFTPSLDCNRHDPQSHCHLFVIDGKIEFCADCYHELAGQTVDMPDVPED